MKRIIALMLVIVFVVTLSACGSKDTVSDTDTSTPTISETFVKPENYATVLLVSINPQFKLYLDENNKVLAVEPVNNDAKSFCKSIDFENKTVEEVVGDIFEKANEKGFIKENAAVDFEITEQKDGVDSSDVLTKVISAANQKATELNVEIKAQIKEKNESQTTESSESTISSQPEETTKKEESASKPTTTTKPTESKPTHKHEFSAATCTTPQKCSCGETKGSALGHKWKEATCEAPKTCSECKATEGKRSDHIINGTTCKMCEKVVAVNPSEFNASIPYSCISKRYGGEIFYYPNEFDCYVFTVICFEGSSHSEAVYDSAQCEFGKDGHRHVHHNGTFYDNIAQSAGLCGETTYTIIDSEIIATVPVLSETQGEKATIHFQLLSNGTLKVSSLSGAVIPEITGISVGAIFHPNPNYEISYN